MTERFLAVAVRMQGRLKEAYALLRLATKKETHTHTYPLGQNAYDLNAGGDWPPGGSSVILGSKTFRSPPSERRAATSPIAPLEFTAISSEEEVEISPCSFQFKTGLLALVLSIWILDIGPISAK